MSCQGKFFQLFSFFLNNPSSNKDKSRHGCGHRTSILPGKGSGKSPGLIKKATQVSGMEHETCMDDADCMFSGTAPHPAPSLLCDPPRRVSVVLCVRSPASITHSWVIMAIRSLLSNPIPSYPFLEPASLHIDIFFYLSSSKGWSYGPVPFHNTVFIVILAGNIWILIESTKNMM